MYESMKQERVCVTFTVDNWAKVVAAVGQSGLNLDEKEFLNSTIYDCVVASDRVTT